ncbi:MAG: M20 family metallopeptidase, partial [Acidimicrobiaceae bacterium]|nr:M20 family metallopeptidase [Acidimicrobiaceae bacterium]
MDIADAKRRVCEEIDRLTPELLDVSHRIHSQPELGFEEHHAHDLLTEVLDDHGLD